MIKRYRFYAIFGKNPTNGDIFPLFNMRVNGQSFQKFYSIPRGLSFGGIDIYKLDGKDFSGTWDNTTHVLTLTTVH